MFHRKMNFLLSLGALVVATTLFVVSPTLLRSYSEESDRRLKQMQKETEQELLAMQQKTEQDLATLDKRTKRIMRDLGFNLRIVHRDTDLTRLYANFVALEMPEEYIDRLANSTEITKIVHLVASIKQMIDWEGQPRLLVGVAPEATQSHIEKKPPMGYQIKPGTVFLGHVAAGDKKVGDEMEIRGRQYEVARILPPAGEGDEDIAIFMTLEDAQQALDKPGKITEILALGCKCKTANRVEEIRSQLELALPEAKVMEMSVKAIARDEQRKLVVAHADKLKDDYLAGREKVVASQAAANQKVVAFLDTLTEIVTPVVVLACALWVGLMAWSNVRERRGEIGLLRALGKRSAQIAGLFLGKAAVLGVIGGAAGCVFGWLLASVLARSVLEVGAASPTPSPAILAASLLGAPLVAAMASYLPAMAAISQDPAVVLMEE